MTKECTIAELRVGREALIGPFSAGYGVLNAATG
jgi:hypothetical protein